MSNVTALVQRLADRLTVVAKALVSGGEALVDSLSPQARPQLVPVRVRRQDSASRR